jgi:hypothetical protein
MAPEATPRAEQTARRNPAVAYIKSLWLGEVPLSRAFWTDMLVIGTVVNVAAGIAAMLLFVSGAPIALGVAIHFAPLPYNLLLFFAVWQAAARDASRWSFPAQVGALVWFFVVFVV